MISFAMKWAYPPFWAWATSHLTSMILGLTAVPARVLTSGPSGVTETISPSPIRSTFFVYGMMAVISEAMNHSFSPIPTTSGAFKRAPIRRSGSCCERMAMA